MLPPVFIFENEDVNGLNNPIFPVCGTKRTLPFGNKTPPLYAPVPEMRENEESTALKIATLDEFCGTKRTRLVGRYTQPEYESVVDEVPYTLL